MDDMSTRKPLTGGGRPSSNRRSTWGSTTSLFRSDTFSCVAFLFFTFNFSLPTQKAGCTCTGTIESQMQKGNPDMPYATPMQSQHGPLMQADWFLTDLPLCFTNWRGLTRWTVVLGLMICRGRGENGVRIKAGFDEYRNKQKALAPHERTRRSTHIILYS